MTDFIGPGATIGFLGGGQLARMMTLEARCMGYRTAVLDPDNAGPAAQVADVFFQGRFDDLDAAQRLAEKSDVITLDTEHIPAPLLKELELITLVRPSAAVLAIVQDRLEQRRFLAEHKVPQVRNVAVSDDESLQQAGQSLGYPLVLKSRRSGYDGKGQARVDNESQLVSAWQSIGRVPAVAEAFVQFACEISVLLARGLDGDMRFYPVAENEHRHHILHITRAPARISEQLERRACDLARDIAVAFDYVGLMAVEMFVTPEGQLLVNEIAPRTHNSGHYTFGACATSQFEQHIRAICGLPLGEPSLHRPACMLNILGDTWARGEPDWRHVFSHPTAHLHLYGKKQARPGRKMGHVLVVEEASHPAVDVVAAIAAELQAMSAAEPPGS